MATGIKRYLRDTDGNILLPYSVASGILMNDGITNVDDRIEYLDDQVSSLTVSGMPKLVSYEYDLYATVDNQVKFDIPYDYFDTATDTLQVSINGTDVPKSYYITTMPVTNGEAITKGFITLNTGRPNGTYIKIRILKNVPIGEEGSINGTVLAEGTIPQDRIVNVSDFAKQTSLNTTNTNVTKNASDIAQLSNPNLFINGDFKIWQRGTSFNMSTSVMQYTADRWIFGGNGTSIASASGSPTSHNTRFNATSNLSASWTRIYQKIEQLTFVNGYTFTLTIEGSFPIGKVIRPYIQYTTGGVPTETVNLGGTITVDNTGWRKYVFTFVMPLFDSGTFIGVGIQMSPCDFALNYMKLEVGSMATPLLANTYAEELAMCQRYYEIIKYYGRVATGMKEMLASIPYKVTKRVIPTKTDKGSNVYDTVSGWISKTAGTSAYGNTECCHFSVSSTNAIVDVQVVIGSDAEIY